jgi:transcriptional regulator with XRE-family HTH domain
MNNKEFLEIGSKIYQIRREKGWTQADLAAAMNTDQQLISRYEQDREGKMSLRKIAEFANVLEVSPFELIGMETPASVAINAAKTVREILVEPNTLPELMQVVSKFASASPDKMQRFVALVSMMFEE